MPPDYKHIALRGVKSKYFLCMSQYGELSGELTIANDSSCLFEERVDTTGKWHGIALVPASQSNWAIGCKRNSIELPLAFDMNPLKEGAHFTYVCPKPKKIMGVQEKVNFLVHYLTVYPKHRNSLHRSIKLRFLREQYELASRNPGHPLAEFEKKLSIVIRRLEKKLRHRSSRHKRRGFKSHSSLGRKKPETPLRKRYAVPAKAFRPPADNPV